MTPSRMILVILAALVVQTLGFTLVHADLLWLNAAPAEIASADVQTLRDRANRVLDREHLTRRHLESIGALTDRAELLPEHLRTLRRLHATHPGEAGVTLRLADALRRAGQYDEARALFQNVLEGSNR